MNTQRTAHLNTHRQPSLQSFSIRTEEPIVRRSLTEQSRTHRQTRGHGSPLMIVIGVLLIVAITYVAFQSAVLANETFHMMAARGAAMHREIHTSPASEKQGQTL